MMVRPGKKCAIKENREVKSSQRSAETFGLRLSEKTTWHTLGYESGTGGSCPQTQTSSARGCQRVTQ